MLALFTDDSDSSDGNQNIMCVIRENTFGGNRENGILCYKNLGKV
jgi:hypothetical protein